MALTDENTSGLGTTMLVQPSGGIGNYGYPVYMGGGNNGGLFGNGDSWLGILFLIALCNGGFGFGGFGGGYGAMMNGMLGYDFPWLMTGQQNINTNTNNGFRDQMINDNITSVRDGIAGLSTQLCGCCGDMQMSLANGFASTNLGIANGTAAIQNSLCNGFNGVNNSIFGAQTAIGQQLNANELASLNRSFAEQTANAQGFNSVQAQLAQCCCDNRAATQDVKYTIATEACNTRAANTANTQAILDKLCQLELDNTKAQIAAEQRENANLRTELMYARGQASQVEQTARILAGQNAEVDALYTRLSNCPVPSTPVYGRQPIFTCPQNVASGCGCGM